MYLLYFKVSWLFDNTWVGTIDVIESEDASHSRNTFLPMIGTKKTVDQTSEGSSNNSESDSDIFSDTSDEKDEVTAPADPRWRTDRSEFNADTSFTATSQFQQKPPCSTSSSTFPFIISKKLFTRAFSMPIKKILPQHFLWTVTILRSSWLVVFTWVYSE